MERLTKKISKAVQDKYSLGSYLQYDFAQADDVNKLLNKLGKFEDLMEKYGLNIISDIEDVFLEFKHTQQENQALKDRWQKLKEFVTNKLKQHIKYGGNNYTLGNVLWEIESIEKEIK